MSVCAFIRFEHFHGFKDHNGVALPDGIADFGFDRDDDPGDYCLDDERIMLFI